MQIIIKLKQNHIENMSKVTSQIKLASILMGIAFIASLIGGLTEYMADQNQWGVKIDNKLLIKQSSGSALSLEHQFGDNVPKDLMVKILDNKGNTFTQPLHSINNNSLTHKLNLAVSKITNVFLQSQSGLKVKANGRLLQSTDESPPFFKFMTVFLTYFFSICRNFILIATVTSTFDVWMPLLMFIESFICLGFWTHNAHTFTVIYKNIFNCKFDLFNFIRLVITDGSELSPNPYLAAYGFSNKFIVNFSGELTILLIVAIGSILIKFSNMFVKSEKLRSISSKLRPVWNGYLLWMSPRICSLAGLSLRAVSAAPQGMETLHLALAVVGILIVLIFFVLLVIQIKKINTKLQYIEESRHQIGLVTRIDYMKDFEFDCLQYSMLYYPAMNAGRIIFAHLCIGFAPDFHYVQFGGVIAAQVFYMMIQISCSGYIHARNKVLYPILDFLYTIFLLCFIGVGLIYGVGHLELTMKLEIVGFTLMMVMTLIFLLQTVFDVIDYCRTATNRSNETFNSTKQLKTHSTKHDYSTKDDGFSDKKQSDKGEKDENIKAEDISEDGTSDYNFVKTEKQKVGGGVRVKKIKKGKLI